MMFTHKEKTFSASEENQLLPPSKSLQGRMDSRWAWAVWSNALEGQQSSVLGLWRATHSGHLAQLVNCLPCKHEDLCLIPKPHIANRRSQAWWHAFVIPGVGRWLDATGSSNPTRDLPPHTQKAPKEWLIAEVGLWGLHTCAHTWIMRSEERKDGRHEKGHARLSNLKTVDRLLIHPLK